MDDINVCPLFLPHSLSQNWYDYVDGFKSFSQRHGYDGLVVLLSVTDAAQRTCQQVAVYSNNADILNQVNLVTAGYTRPDADFDRHTSVSNCRQALKSILSVNC